MSKRVPKALRAAVRTRAKGRCEYCLIHEDDTFFSHQPDHIIALKHHGKTRPENLAWACYLCNLLKSSNLASVDWMTGRVVRLFNPRKDSWSRHFRLEGSVIVARTAIGRATEQLLQLNQKSLVKARQKLIAAKRYPRG
jgi:hypothetical protein